MTIPKAIAASTDWFYVKSLSNGREQRVQPVATWGLDLEGNVFGLVAVDGELDTRYPPFLEPAGSGGRYLHRDQLTEAQLTAAKSGRLLELLPRPITGSTSASSPTASRGRSTT